MSIIQFHHGMASLLFWPVGKSRQSFNTSYNFITNSDLIILRLVTLHLRHTNLKKVRVNCGKKLGMIQITIFYGTQESIFSDNKKIKKSSKDYSAVLSDLNPLHQSLDKLRD